MLRRLIPLLALGLTALAPLPALATPPEVLVEERARETWGPELPGEAAIRVTFSGPRLEDAVLLSAFWMDRSSGRFLANAVTEAGREIRIEGLAVATLTLPVPARRMMPGEVLRDGDLTELVLPLGRVGAYAVTARDDLLGKQVKRMLAQGRPVMVQSVTEPLVIDRGDRISILYDDGRLQLTAPGRALEAAHRGQELRIVNLVSNKSLVAIARADGTAEVLR